MVLKNPQSKQQKPAQRPGGDVQSRVDLQPLAIFFLGEPIGDPIGESLLFVSPWDADALFGSLQVWPGHWIDGPRRGSAINFVQRMKRYKTSDQAIAYLSGWLDGRESLR